MRYRIYIETDDESFFRVLFLIYFLVWFILKYDRDYHKIRNNNLNAEFEFRQLNT